MKPLRIQLRVVFYRESEAWIAHCLEFDLMGDGQSKESALEMLFEAIGLQIRETVESGNMANLFSPADGQVFRMFAAGKDIAKGVLGMPTEEPSVDVSGWETREYDPETSEDPADADCVMA